jgi:hypothetical protein
MALGLWSSSEILSISSNNAVSYCCAETDTGPIEWQVQGYSSELWSEIMMAGQQPYSHSRLRDKFIDGLWDEYRMKTRSDVLMFAFALFMVLILARESYAQMCMNIPSTYMPVGAACFPRSLCPNLINPQDPVVYGADKTGSADSTAPFQRAANRGDLFVSRAGSYLINGSVIPPAGRRVECAAGVTLKTTLHNNIDSGILTLRNNNVTVCGCDFQGNNTARVGGAKAMDANQGNFLIQAIDSSEVMIEGNTFENTWANSAIQFNTASTGPGVTNSIIQFNTFSGNPYYGPEIDSGAKDTIQNNLSTDSPIGVENDGCSTEPIGHITITNNMVRVVHGDCRIAGVNGCDEGVFITGGDYPPGCDYSSNSVTNNYCTGGATQIAHINNTSPGGGGTAASYSGNILGPSCSCTGAANCGAIESVTVMPSSAKRIEPGVPVLNQPRR